MLYFIIFDLWYLQYTQIKGNCCISPQLFLCLFNYRFLPVLVMHEQNNVDENFDLKIHKMFDFYLLQTKSKAHRSREKFLERIYPKTFQKLSSITKISQSTWSTRQKKRYLWYQYWAKRFPKVFFGSKTLLVSIKFIFKSSSLSKCSGLFSDKDAIFVSSNVCSLIWVSPLFASTIFFSFCFYLTHWQGCRYEF